MKKNQKDSDGFPNWKLTLKVKFWEILIYLDKQKGFTAKKHMIAKPKFLSKYIGHGSSFLNQHALFLDTRFCFSIKFKRFGEIFTRVSRHEDADLANWSLSCKTHHSNWLRRSVSKRGANLTKNKLKASVIRNKVWLQVVSNHSLLLWTLCTFFESKIL